jgi:hypothetical protein
MRHILNWFRLRNLEKELIANQLPRRSARELVRSGLSETEARRQAALDLGGVTQVREEVRDVWRSRWLRDFVYDLRFSARAFRRSPSFALTAVLSLALGIGATAAMYSLLDQVVLHALPVRDPERLVLIDERRSGHRERIWQLQPDVVPRYAEICRNRTGSLTACSAVLTTVTFSPAENTFPRRPRSYPAVTFRSRQSGTGRLFTMEDDQRRSKRRCSARMLLKVSLRAPGCRGRKVWVNRHPMTGSAGGSRVPRHRRRRGSFDLIPAPMSAEAIPGFPTWNRRVRWMQLGRCAGHDARTGESWLQPWFKATLDEGCSQCRVSKVSRGRQRFLTKP